MITEAMLTLWGKRIKQACLREGVFDDAFSGHCDAFALALQEVCKEESIPCALVRIERQRMVSAPGPKILEHNPLSHVVVEVSFKSDQGLGMQKVCMDASGVDADVSWEENWLQPYQNPESDEDEEQAEDHFSYHPIKAKELKILRQSRDRRDVDVNYQCVYRNLIAEQWFQLKQAGFKETSISTNAFEEAARQSVKNPCKNNKNIF